MARNLDLAIVEHIPSRGLLMVTIPLGALFLAIKGIECYEDCHKGLFPDSAFTWTGSDPGHVQLLFDPLLSHDRFSCAAPDYRDGTDFGHAAVNMEMLDQQPAFRAARCYWYLLAFRRSRLDFSFPAALPAWSKNIECEKGRHPDRSDLLTVALQTR